MTALLEATCLVLASGCATQRPPQIAPDVGVEHLGPGLALRILDRSPRHYVLQDGRLAADSVAAPYVGMREITADDLDPGAADTWNEASLEMHLGNYARAGELFASLVEAVPGCAICRIEFAHALLGVASLQGQKRDTASGLRRRAADELRIAAAIDPALPTGRGMFDAPHRLGRTTVALWPKSDEAQQLYAAGNDSYNRDDDEGARHAYFEMLRLEPRFGRGYVAVGDTYYEDGDYTAAGLWYDRALDLDSTDYAAWRSLGRCYQAIGLLAEARDAAIRAVMYNYQDEESWDFLSTVGFMLDYSVARRRVDKRVEMFQTPDGAIHILADSSLADGAQTAWISYGAVRAVWRYEGRFAARISPRQPYRPTFEEQVEATATLAAVWGRGQRDSAEFDDQLDRLWGIVQVGYLAEYVIFEEMAADDPDIMAYLPADVLARVREYIRRFVIGGVPI